MLSSIHPLGERAKGNRWGLTITAFALGSLAGGATSGAVAGLVGTGIRLAVEPSIGVVQALVAAVVVAAVVFDLHPGGLRLPTVHRQVDERWLNRYRGWVYGAGYGFQLGLGVVTIVTTAAVYAALLLAVLAGSLVGGIVVGAVFGLVRGLTGMAGREVTTPAELRGFHATLDQRRQSAGRIVPLAEILVAVIVVSSIAVR